MKSGTTIECFQDLVLQIGPENYEKRRALASVVGVEDATIRRWVNAEFAPVGMSLLSLRYYLDFLGYEVSEVIHLDPVFRAAGRMLAFRVLTLLEMAQMTSHEDHPDQVLAVLRGAKGTSPARRTLFEEVVDSYKVELEEKIKQLPKVIELKPSVGTTQLLAQPRAVKVQGFVPVPPVRGSDRTSKRDLRVFAGLVQSLEAMADYYTSPEVTEEMRDELRAVVGQENIFNLKNQLARLCGSKAFNNLQ